MPLFLKTQEVMVSFSELKGWVKSKLNIDSRLSEISMYFVVFLMTKSPKFSQKEAARFSGKHPSQVSRYLRNNSSLAINELNRLSRKQSKKLSKKMALLLKNVPHWRIAIIIDSTLQARHSLHAENVQRFNHGYGYVVGHQWTNIVLYFNGMLIPLPPIPFYSKNYCKKNNFEYETEGAAIINYLEELNLEDFVGLHRPDSVVVLADSGYDIKKIERTILKRCWHFIFALKSSHSICDLSECKKAIKKRRWIKVKDFFSKDSLLEWLTIRILKAGNKKKRLDYRTRNTLVFLNGVDKIQLVYSEYKKRPDGRKKYLACSDLRVNVRQIVLGYRLRWKIEIFHKHIKMHMGFEDIAAHDFNSVISHVYWIYCAYILLNMLPKRICPRLTLLSDRKMYVQSIVDNNMLSMISQRLSRINGVQALKNDIIEALNKGEANFLKAT